MRWPSVDTAHEAPDRGADSLSSRVRMPRRSAVRPTASSAAIAGGASSWLLLAAGSARAATEPAQGAGPALLLLLAIVAALVVALAIAHARARARASAAERTGRELAARNRDLEHEIAERTRELADRSADLGTITDSVAHDLRNPLNTISVNTELLEQQYGSLLGADGQMALERTSAGVQRMAEILDRLLGLSVVSDSAFHRERVNITEMVRDLFDELAAAEPPPAVELALADLPDANADPALVRTLALNLLRNALKFTRGRDRRRVEVGYELTNRIPVYFVRDNGVGFDGDSAELLFRSAERSGQDADRGRGTGLGLNIAVRVVRRHRGRIWAESRAGEGAAFYFTLEPEAAVPRP